MILGINEAIDTINCVSKYSKIMYNLQFYEFNFIFKNGLINKIEHNPKESHRKLFNDSVDSLIFLRILRKIINNKVFI